VAEAVVVVVVAVVVVVVMMRHGVGGGGDKHKIVRDNTQWQEERHRGEDVERSAGRE
jgi:hypothetical protein